MSNYEFTLTLTGSGDTEGAAWTDAVDAFCADPGEPQSVVNLDEDLPKFTVMLLRPDYATDGYGQDTFTETTEALNVDQAINFVKNSCFDADGREEEEYSQYCDDLHVLAVMKGAVEFVS